MRAKCETEECEAVAKGYAWPEIVGREVDLIMELSARDKRILADIECASALDDPRWTRRFERLGREEDGRRHGWARARFYAVLGLVFAAWIAALVLSALLLRPLLWGVLGVGAAGLAAAALRRRHVYGYWYRPSRRISRIPHQDQPGSRED